MNHEDELLQQLIIQNLSVGMIVKNYKELCNLLNLPVVSGNQKKAQLKEIERYIDYEKEKQKFVITEIYDSPQDKADKRKERGVYTKYIQIILMDILVNRSDNEYTYIGTKSDLLLELGMASVKHRRYGYGFLANQIPGLQDWEFEDYYNWSSKRLGDILSYSLKALSDARLIDCRLEKVPYIQENGNLVPIAICDETIKEVLEIENRALQEINCEFISQINSKNKWRNFYYHRNKIAMEYGYCKIQDQFRIVYLEKSIRERLEKEKAELQKMLLNNEIVDMLKRTSVTMIENKNKEAEKQFQYILDQLPPVAFGKRPVQYKEYYGIKYYDDVNEQKEKVSKMIDLTIKTHTATRFS